jgi:hypothetical protein
MSKERAIELFEKLLSTAKEIDSEIDEAAAQEERLAKAVAEAVRQKMKPEVIFSKCAATLTAAKC